jgi:hypothetical protein
MTMPRGEISASHQNQPIVVHPPRSIDIVFGRGKPVQDHPGNVRMKNIIRQYKTAYHKGGKNDKKMITERVVYVISNDDLSGKVHFLKQKKTGIDEPWCEANRVEIWKKVRHCLRCTKQYIRKHLLTTLSSRNTVTAEPHRNHYPLAMLSSSLFEDYEEGSSLEDCLTAARNVASCFPPVSSFALKDKDILRAETLHEEEDDDPLVALPIVLMSNPMTTTASEEEELFGDINGFQGNDPGSRPPSPSIFDDIDDNRVLISPLFDEGHSPCLS